MQPNIVVNFSQMQSNTIQYYSKMQSNAAKLVPPQVVTYTDRVFFSQGTS